MSLDHDRTNLTLLTPSRGRHSSPAAGTCLMEMASVLAAEPFTDHPECVPPALALAARLVNDHVADSVRQGLVQLLPEMMDGPRTDLRAGPVIALACLDDALRLRPDRGLRRRRRRVLRLLARLDDGVPSGRLRDLRRRLAVFTSVRSSAAHLRPCGQDELAQMLVSATHAYSGIGRQAPGRSPQRDRALAPAAG